MRYSDVLSVREDEMPEIDDRARVFYDGDCSFCRKSVEVLRRLDWRRRLAYVDMRRNPELLLRMGGAPRTLFDQMHVLPPGGKRLLSGFDGIRWLAWRLPTLCLIAPLFYLPGAMQLGRRLYAWVARHRFRLLPCRDGVCAIQHKPNA